MPIAKPVAPFVVPSNLGDVRRIDTDLPLVRFVFFFAKAAPPVGLSRSPSRLPDCASILISASTESTFRNEQPIEKSLCETVADLSALKRAHIGEWKSDSTSPPRGPAHQLAQAELTNLRGKRGSSSYSVLRTVSVHGTGLTGPEWRGRNTPVLLSRSRGMGLSHICDL